MTVAEFVPLVWLKFRAKGADKAPAENSPKWKNIVALANTKLRDKWAIDPNISWDTLSREDTFSASDVIEMEDDFAKVTDRIRIKKDDQTLYATYVPFTRRFDYENTCYRSGKNPATITFTNGVPSQYTGGTVYVPINYLPEKLVTGTDEIVCDNPSWLIAEVAAALAIKKPMYAELTDEAKEEYQKMVSAQQTPAYGMPGEMAIDMPELC